MGRGSFIIGIEGIDAVGKHTQSHLLETWLKDNGFECTILSFPDYETAIGREIRAFLAGERNYPSEVRHMLFAANRWEKASTIAEYQAEGKVIIVNRYTESNLVYGSANGLSMDWLVALERGIPKADLVLVLDAPPKMLTMRRPEKDSYEKNQDLQAKTGALYKELALRFDWSIVDATGTIDETHGYVVEIVKRRLLGLERSE